jgi:hypothetical protein
MNAGRRKTKGLKIARPWNAHFRSSLDVTAKASRFVQTGWVRSFGSGNGFSRFALPA